MVESYFEILENIGLTKNQAIVYLSLLKLGSVTVHSIIKETSLHSSRVYDSLEKLHSLGLVSYVVKDSKRYLQAIEPERLVGYLEEQKEMIKQILPQLKQLEGMKKEEINGFLYKGKEGLKSILSLVLKEAEDIYVLGAKGFIFSELKYFMPNFEKERIKRKLRFIRLYEIDAKTKELDALFVIQKKLPRGSSGDSVVWIFGTKVAIILWKEKYPSAFLINNKQVADSFRKWFKIIYHAA